MKVSKQESSRNIRKPFEPATEPHHVRFVLAEIAVLAKQESQKQVFDLAQSVLGVINRPSGIEAAMIGGLAQLVERVFLRIPQSRENHISGLIFEPSGDAVRFSYDGTQYRVDSQWFAEEVTPSGLERSRGARALSAYLTE